MVFLAFILVIAFGLLSSASKFWNQNIRWNPCSAGKRLSCAECSLRFDRFHGFAGNDFSALAEAVRGPNFRFRLLFQYGHCSDGICSAFLDGCRNIDPMAKNQHGKSEEKLRLAFFVGFSLDRIIAFWLRDELWSWDGYIIFWLAFFVCATMANELIRLVRLRSSQSEDSAPVALFMVIRRNLRRYGEC